MPDFIQGHRHTLLSKMANVFFKQGQTYEEIRKDLFETNSNFKSPLSVLHIEESILKPLFEAKKEDNNV